MNKWYIRLVMVFCAVVLFFSAGSIKAEASTMNRHLAGDTETRTNITEPGTSDSAEDLKNLNIANTMTVTYSDGNGTLAGSLRILLILTAIAVAPTLLICLTSFTRILIVLHFTRMALNTQSAPPNQVLIGLALFLTFFIMSPTINTCLLYTSPSPRDS